MTREKERRFSYVNSANLFNSASKVCLKTVQILLYAKIALSYNDSVKTFYKKCYFCTFLLTTEQVVEGKCKAYNYLVILHRLLQLVRNVNIYFGRTIPTIW